MCKAFFLSPWPAKFLGIITAVLVSVLTVGSVAYAQQEKVYNLNIQHKTVNFTGKSVAHAIAINGSIPAPTLRFRKGDIAVINVKNELHEATSLHWHGVLVPWNMDGPSFSNNKLIQPGETFTFRFQIKQTGTYWYHSHTMLQEQIGLYGAIVIEDETPKFRADHDRVIVLSDWNDEHPMQTLRNIKSSGDYYSFKKKSFPSIADAIRRGEFWDYLKSEWVRMGPMDLSDIGYDIFLANGAQSQNWSDIKPNETVRLRIINAGASSYFYLNFGKLRDFYVISKDGVEVVPVGVTEILIGMGETYDIFLKMPEEQMSLEFRATSLDTTGYSRILFGQGQSTELVPDKVRPSPYKMGGGENDGKCPPDQHWDAGMGMCMPGKCPAGQHWDDGMSMCMPGADALPAAKFGLPKAGVFKEIYKTSKASDDGDDDPPVSKRLSYDMLKSPVITEFDPALQRHDITLEFTGDMNRYTWYINGRPFSEEKYISIKYNEVVRFKMVNKTMMHHPMHLHGHFFRVLNGQGKFSPNFHTVDVGPMETVTVEFWANEPGTWFFHCHNLFHMEMGMARLIKYEDFNLPDDLVQHAKEYERKFMTDSSFLPSGEIGAYSNHADLKARLNGGRWDVSLELELDKYDKDTFQGDIMFKRYLSQYLALLGGGEYEDQELYAILGMAYTLPLRIEVIAYTRSDGKSVIKLFKSIPIYGKLSLDLAPKMSFKDGKYEGEVESTLNYQYSPNVKVGVFFKDDNKVGNTVGFGISVKF